MRTRDRRQLALQCESESHPERLLALLGACLWTSCASAAYHAGFASVDANLGGESVSVSGPMIGVSGGGVGPGPTGFAELRLLEGDGIGVDAVEITFGGRTRPRPVGPLELRGQLDMGIAGVDVDGFQNEVSLISFGVGLQPSLRLGPRLALVGLAGFRYYIDATEPTTCNDGTTSSSVGSGTCSHHGGIAHYNDHIGDGGALELTIGLSWTVGVPGAPK